jgi:mycothiol synthase
VEDVPRIAELVAACGSEDGVALPGADEVAGWLRDNAAEVEASFRVWFRDGKLVAYSDLGVWNGAAWLDVHVRPDQRGGVVEDEVLAWNVARARELEPELGLLRRSVSAADARGLAAGKRAGFAAVRRSYVMRTELEAPPRPPEPPAGIELRRFRPGEEREVWAVHQEAFRDVPEQDQEESYDSWREDRIEDTSFDPTLWTVADADGEIAGIALCSFRNGDGWIGIVGVRRPWRRRGLGTALLRESFGLFWDRGERIVSLGVDAEIPDALRLYQREGMRVASCSMTLELPLHSVLHSSVDAAPSFSLRARSPGV